MSFKILQWNIRGFRANQLALLEIIEKESPSVIALQETFLNKDYNPSLRGYHVISHNRSSNHGGGTLIAIKRGLTFIPNQLNTNIEHSAITIKLNNKPLTITNVYIPPAAVVNPSILQNLVTKNQHQIILGDFNAHHQHWKCQSDSGRGKIVYDWLLTNRLSTMNHSPTHYNRANNNYSCIDLTITQTKSITNWHWSTLTDLYGSDHFPIIVSQTISQTRTHYNQVRWRPSKESLILYSKDCNLSLSSALTIEENYQVIVNQIHNHAKRHMRTKTFNPKFTKSWWNSSCEVAIKNKKKSFRKFQNCPTDSNWVKYKACVAIAKKTVKTAKLDDYKKFLESINSDPDSKSFWGKIKSLEGKPARSKEIILLEGDDVVTDQEIVSNILGSTFSENSSDNKKPFRFLNSLLSREDAIHLRVSTAICQGNDLEYNNNLTSAELNHVLNLVKDSAPGRDKVVYSMITHLNQDALMILLNLFNSIWCEQVVPTDWKESLLIPILKPGKIKSSKNSYRPIALTSTLAKIFEKCILVRINDFLSTIENPLTHHTGFRRNYSTYDSVIQLETSIRQGFNKKQFCMCIFVDIEKAYESVWTNGLLDGLVELGMQGRLLSFLKNFITGRSFQTRVGMETSEKFYPQYGLPQGSILSPLLFNLMTSNYHRVLPPTVSSTIYADDLAIWMVGGDITILRNSIQQALEDIGVWFESLGLQLSKEKTHMVIFTKRKVPALAPIKLEGVNIPIRKSTRYLGLTLDSRLHWGDHVSKVKASCNRRMQICKYLSNSSWGASRQVILRTYKTLIRPIVDYGLFFYFPFLSQSNKLVMNRIQYEGIRVSTGALRATRVNLLEPDAGITTINFRSRYLAQKFFAKKLSSSGHPTRALMVGTQGDPTTSDQNCPVVVTLQRDASRLGLAWDQIATMKEIHKVPSNIYVDTTLTRYPKRYVSSEVIQNHFQELKAKYSSLGYQWMASDGSKKKDSTACAVVTPTSCLKIKLPSFSSIFTAELFAIFKSIEYSNRMKYQRSIILTDSLSAALSLRSPAEGHFLAADIARELAAMQDRTIIVLWCPSHAGIKANEYADQLANEAHDTGIPIQLKMTPQEACHITTTKLQQERISEWTSSLERLSSINPDMSSDIYIGLPRRKEVVLTRLRLNVCKFQLLHHFNNEIPEIRCSGCNAKITFKHLIECPNFISCREELKREVTHHGLTMTEKDLLTTDLLLEPIFRFLRRTGFYDLI